MNEYVLTKGVHIRAQKGKRQSETMGSFEISSGALNGTNGPEAGMIRANVVT